MGYVENIISEYLNAPESVISDGMTWYNDANALALELSPGDAWRGAGVIAAFSPMCPWNRNVELARNTFATGIATGHTKAMCGMAQRIHDGEFTLDVLKGDKTRAFASAIADPANSTIATIDRHAHDIAMGRQFTDDTRKIGKVVFRTLSSAYVEAAELAGIGVAQMQAITWVAWRIRKGIA
jgi:hypothetical protein